MAMTALCKQLTNETAHIALRDVLFAAQEHDFDLRRFFTKESQIVKVFMISNQ
jgi:hypothetical protein